MFLNMLFYDACILAIAAGAILLASDCFIRNCTAEQVAAEINSAASGTWSTASLSVARSTFAATSLPGQGLALFAGGQGALFYFFGVWWH